VVEIRKVISEMDDAEIRVRVEAVQHRDRNLLRGLGPELTAHLERVVDDLFVCKLLLHGLEMDSPPDFRSFAPSAAIAEAALEEWKVDVGIGASMLGSLAAALREQIHRERNRMGASAITS
jgi:hypothetical protein